ncbi:amidohydrolase family protein [Candidatus Soleaferrea massiliensis]|uniref:amidohydrolase family protein n=1 Tax=Candidatus Soleaferrea massiliensis TaxID=1470354 RepID=UPI00058AED3A|nr:amidohydrolase family protein [Candidatus Soleaferrea massiliensis]
MVIDMCVHPGFLKEICGDEERVLFRRKHFGLYKQSVWPVELFIKQLDAAGIDKAVLIPEDLTVRCGDSIVSNEEIKTLCELMPDRAVGFASVDPNRADASEVLEDAFTRLGLAGLVLNPSTQRFYPGDEKLAPLYECCIRHDKPLILQMGVSLQPDAPAKYAKPLLCEDVLLSYPQLRVCVSHFGWPWVTDVAALLLKYENLYADTAMLYYDSPKEFMHYVFEEQMGRHWADRTLHSKILFGSGYPRIEQKRMRQAVESLELRDSTKQKILGDNARQFLYGEAE